MQCNIEYVFLMFLSKCLILHELIRDTEKDILGEDISNTTDTIISSQ